MTFLHKSPMQLVVYLSTLAEDILSQKQNACMHDSFPIFFLLKWQKIWWRFPLLKSCETLKEIFYLAQAINARDFIHLNNCLYKKVITCLLLFFFSHYSRYKPVNPQKTEWQWYVFYQFNADTCCWVKIDCRLGSSKFKWIY